MLLVCDDLLMWYLFIAVNILNNKSITSRSFVAFFQFFPVPVAKSVECLLLGMGSHVFDSGPPYIKLLKWYSLGTQTYGVVLGLVDPGSG